MTDESNESFDTPSTKERDLILGEKFAAMSRMFGKLAAKFLFRGQWVYEEPEWFDHRLHLLDPDVHFNDFWTASADNVIRVLPLGGTMLDLCCGDGFYDYWFYRYRAARITCVDSNPDALALAVKHHAHPKIEYVLADVLTYSTELAGYDVVLIRGAIEHFTPEQQISLFWRARYALRYGGYFCGDTPAKRPGQDKVLNAHEHEWANETEMRDALAHVFTDNEMETWTLVSENRTTLFWRCRKQ